MKEKLLISACFLKPGFKYNGLDNFNEQVLALSVKYDFYLVCPEVDGGLSTPRNPSEIVGSKVINNLDFDVTYNFILGAQKALQVAQKYDIKKALLKAKSPSCGKGVIYDGTFTHTLTEGDGVTCKLLKENGIEVYTELEIDNL